MAPESPTQVEIRHLLDRLNLPDDEESIGQYRELVAGTLEVYHRTEELPEPRELRPDTYNDRAVQGPTAPEQDAYNAWITQCTVPGADSGLLAGMSVSVKDNIAVAGVPMTCGSHAMRGYIPDIDARVVSRLLNAGGTIVGKANMDSFGFSALGVTSDFGPVLNPHDSDHLAGGSSAGSAVSVVTGDTDIAIGADQGGSIRHPAAWSGCVGHKPTHGLVPYTGVAGLDPTVDHVGPLGPSVEPVAACLEAIAGEDPLDPRQASVPDVAYTKALENDIDDLTLGVLSEGFGLDGAEDVVEEAVMSAIDELDALGATVRQVSVPFHHEAYAVHLPLLIQGSATTVRNGGVGYGFPGFYDTEFADFFNRVTTGTAKDLPLGLQVARIAGEYLTDAYGARYYAKASNLRRRFREAYDEAFEEVDLLAMPTTPMRAFEYDPSMSEVEWFEVGLDPQPNTSPFNVTGHPALTLPCALRDGLPVAIQLVGQHFDDARVLRVAAHLEDAIDWEAR
jgi:amidase